MKRLLIAAIFISPSVFAAYTEMVIEGVKQSNGVWTAAGVMDTQGFVRTTGAVTVYGTTRNLPVALAADIPASSAMLKFAARAAGPVALAAAAYDVYDWVKSDPDIGVQGNNWVESQNGIESFGNYWQTENSVSTHRCAASSPDAAASCVKDKYNASSPMPPLGILVPLVHPPALDLLFGVSLQLGPPAVQLLNFRLGALLAVLVRIYLPVKMLFMPVMTFLI